MPVRLPAGSATQPSAVLAVVPVRLIGKLPLASALVFDLGVLLTVAGATLLGVVALGRLGARAAAAAEPGRRP